MGEEQRAHSILSASASKQWMTCTPSARLGEAFHDTKSDSATEGTFAHLYAELRLGRAVANTVKPSVYKKRLAELQKNPLYSASLEEYIDQYVTIVGEKFLSAKKNCPDTLILLEQTLNYSEWAPPDNKGTADVVIISDGILEIIDLKYGKNVPVYAPENTQLRLYALGAISEYGMLYDFDLIRMTIAQPRLDNITSDEISVSALLKWGDEVVRPLAALAFEGEGELVIGDHCQFCKAKALCRAQAERNLEIAKYEFSDPKLLSDDEVSDVLSKMKQIQSWLKSVSEYTLDRAVNHGKKWPGWKLVEGKSDREYACIEDVAKKLKEEGYTDEVIYKPKELLGITAMEKKLGKKLFEDYLKDLVVKPTGKPTLVSESDKRPEINSTASAEADFANENFDDILN